MTADKLNKIQKLIRELLIHIGEDPKREGILQTPSRVAKAWGFLSKGYQQDLDALINNAIFKEDYDEMVTVKDIDYFSLCEHHLLPFFGKAHVAYIPNGYIVGLSKIPRVIDIFSKRLQVQERLTDEIRDCIQDTLNPKGVAIVIEAQHLCMQMRGVEKQHSSTTTSAFSGVFMNDNKTRAEFMHLIKQS